MNAPERPPLRLTELAHGGGCGCKLAPAVLQELLAGQPAAAPFRQLLVGTETGDDAAVWQLDDNTCDDLCFESAEDGVLKCTACRFDFSDCGGVDCEAP